MSPQKQASLMISEYSKIIAPHVQVATGLAKSLAIREAENTLAILKYNLHKQDQSPILYWKEVINQLNK